jgi:hypothetical protein
MEGGTLSTDSENTSVTKDIDDQSAGFGFYYVDFTTDVMKKVMLKHDQSLNFINLPVGTIFKATEGAALKWTPSYIHTENDTPGAKVAGPEAKALSFDLGLVTEGDDDLTFTNEYNFEISLGISLNDLPYVVLLILIGLGIALLAFGRYRKTAKYEEKEEA